MRTGARPVFVDIREVEEDAEGRYGRLCAELDGRSVPRVARAIREIDLAPGTVLGEMRARGEKI